MGSIFTGEASLKKIQELEGRIEGFVSSKDILEDGKIKQSLIPGSTDEVHEFDTFADFPAIADAKKDVIYIDLSTNYQYRFSGSQYINISSSIIHDEAEGDVTTYSSKKINELIRNKTEIDDTSNSTVKTLSSAKIKENYQTKIITDVGGFFTDKTVEGALQQIGNTLNGLENLLREI